MISVDKRQAGLRIKAPPKVPRRFRKDDLHRWAHDTLDEMTAMSRGVAPAEHDVSVHVGLVLLEGDVSEQRQHLDLFLELDVPVLARGPVEEGHDHARQRADGRELCRSHPVFSGEGGDRRHDLVAGGEDDRKRAESLMIVQQCRLHAGRPVRSRTSAK